MSDSCKKCSISLEKRNKTGFCTAHRGLWQKTCSSCEDSIYGGSRTNLCKKCYYNDFYSRNKQSINAHYNKVYHDNKKEINLKRKIREKKRWHTEPDFKLKKSLRSRFKKAMRENWVSGSFTDGLGCSIPELRQHISSLFYKSSTNEEMTWENYGKKWEIDHKIAFCFVNLSDPAQLAIISHYSNLRPLWKEDHIIKTTEDRKK